MLFVVARKTTVWAVTHRNCGTAANEVKSFAPLLKFTNPHGVRWTKDGFPMVAEYNRILNFPAAEFFKEGTDAAVIEALGQGRLIPVEEGSYIHCARVCRVGNDGMLPASLGQPHNVQPRDKIDLYNKVGIGGMVRTNAFDGSKREVFADGWLGNETRRYLGRAVDVVNPPDGSILVPHDFAGAVYRFFGF